LAERTDAEKAEEKKAADDEAAEVNRLINQPMPTPSAAQKAANEGRRGRIRKNRQRFGQAAGIYGQENE